MQFRILPKRKIRWQRGIGSDVKELAHRASFLRWGWRLGQGCAGPNCGRQSTALMHQQGGWLLPADMPSSPLTPKPPSGSTTHMCLPAHPDTYSPISGQRESCPAALRKIQAGFVLSGLQQSLRDT